MTGFATASFLSFGILLVIFGANATGIISALELDYAAFGLLGSMLSLGLGIGIVIAGPIVDRTPWRPLYLAACLVVIAATTTLGPQTSYRVLLLHMIAIGFGAGFYETVVNAMVIQAFGSAASRRLLFIHSGAAFAACVAPLVLGWTREALAFEWHDTFRLAGLCHVPLILGAFFVGPSRSPRRDEMALHAGPETATTPLEAQSLATTSLETTSLERADDRVALAAICLAAFAYVGVESALTIFVVDYVEVDLAFDALRAARTIGAFWGGLFLGRFVSGLVPRSPGSGTNAILGIAGAALVLGFGSLRIELPELTLALVGLALSSAFPILIGLAGRALPSSPATAVGVAGGLGSLGGFVVPWWTGELASRSGLPFAIASLSGWLVLLASASAVARFRRVA